MTKEIPLTNGSSTVIDDCDDDLANLKWRFSQGYAVRTVGPNISRQQERLHRVILERAVGRPLKKQEDTDHINGDKLDNRRDNLRIATRSQNVANQPIKSNNKSGYKGVYWDIGSRKWRASIDNGKEIYLGRYADPAEAARAYDAKAIELFGEFAYLNFHSEKSSQ